MNANAAAILTDPHPCGHIVYPYTDEGLVGQAVALFASSGFRNGESVILIMTAAHVDSITLRLLNEGHNVEALQKSGRLTCVVAENLMAEFIVEGAPNEDLFRAIVGRMIADGRASTGKGSRGQVRVFGEMVSLMWCEDLRSTISLEDMWNRIIDEHSVSLMCTYALNGRKEIPEAIHALHSHSIAADPFC